MQNFPLLYLWDLGHRNHAKENILGASFGTEPVSKGNAKS